MIVAFVLWIPLAQADAPTFAQVWRISPATTGEVWINDERLPLPPKPPRPRLERTSRVRTGNATWVELYFPSQALAVLGPNSQVTVDAAFLRSGLLERTLNIAGNSVRIVLEAVLPSATLHLSTGDAQANAQEGDFLFQESTDGKTRVLVFDGQLEVVQGTNTVKVREGQLLDLQDTTGTGLRPMSEEDWREEVRTRFPETGGRRLLLSPGRATEGASLSPALLEPFRPGGPPSTAGGSVFIPDPTPTPLKAP